MACTQNFLLHSLLHMFKAGMVYGIMTIRLCINWWQVKIWLNNCMGPRAFPYSIWEYVCVLIAHSNINAFPFIVKVSSCDTIIQLMFIKSQNSQFIKSVLFIVYKSRIFDFITSQTRKHMSFFFMFWGRTVLLYWEMLVNCIITWNHWNLPFLSQWPL